MVEPTRVWELLEGWLTPDDADLVRAVVYRFHATVADAMRVGRVFLAGDAAHQMPPFLGQGLCSGIRDAANLAWKLRLVDDGLAGDALLDTYGDERLPHAAGVVEHAVDTGRLIDELSGRAPQQTGLDAAYGGSRPFPILRHGMLFGDHPSVGRQLPQPTVDGQPLDELLGTGFAHRRRRHVRARRASTSGGATSLGRRAAGRLAPDDAAAGRRGDRATGPLRRRRRPRRHRTRHGEQRTARTPRPHNRPKGPHHELGPAATRIPPIATSGRCSPPGAATAHRSSRWSATPIDDDLRLLVSAKAYTAKWKNAVRQPKVCLTVPDGRIHLVVYGEVEPIDADPLRAELTAQIFGALSGNPAPDPAIHHPDARRATTRRPAHHPHQDPLQGVVRTRSQTRTRRRRPIAEISRAAAAGTAAATAGLRPSPWSNVCAFDAEDPELGREAGRAPQRGRRPRESRGHDRHRLPATTRRRRAARRASSSWSDPGGRSEEVASTIHTVDEPSHVCIIRTGSPSSSASRTRGSARAPRRQLRAPPRRRRRRPGTDCRWR